MRRCICASFAAVLVLLCACASSEAQSDATTEKRCGSSPSVYFTMSSAEDVASYSGCTVLVGHLQQDSVTALADFSGLESVERIEGTLNVFRSPGLTSLRGLENLAVVEGDLFIHLNPNLTSLAALEKLRTVTGTFVVEGNDRLPQSDVDALTARVSASKE